MKRMAIILIIVVAAASLLAGERISRERVNLAG